MSSFFTQTAETILNKHIDRYPLLKIQKLLDWQKIEQILVHKKVRSVPSNVGRPAYPVLSMFKAVLLGQWHSLSDPELERSLMTRLDFILFCQFDELNIPDHSTLCRFRNALALNQTLDKLLNEINRQLTERQLKIEHAAAAVVDATVIQTAGGKQRKTVTVEVNEDSEPKVQELPPSKDKDARWIKKNGHFHLGYKQHTRTDEEGYIEKIHITAANEHETKHLEPLLENIEEGTTLFADKGYDSQANRERLLEKNLNDGIMRKAQRGHALSREEIIRNKILSKTRYVVEQSFAILHRRFRYSRASYFGLEKVKAQSCLKAICLNLLKAANKLRLIAPITA